ncbi:MAG: hypothetical protein A2Y38_24460 [Spirochaetes bacterium GWB1_59_5]|nr:MAG: hypothetical protein A2Y38_24460 [Spirochaetes bacterium GWB1_59_5]
MKSLILYDSVFGNTRTIAEAIGKALGAPVRSVTEISTDDLQGIELFIVGSPTRAFRPTKPLSRFLGSLHAQTLTGVQAAAFDTRADLADLKSKLLDIMVRIFGYAAPCIEKQLRKKGARVIASAEGFFIKGTEGPLKEGEPARAVTWAAALKVTETIVAGQRKPHETP